MNVLRWLLALGVLAGFCFSAGPAQEKKVTITPVKYEGLKQEILKHRGKVVVVDFWATWCPPCVKSFPHFIDLHTQYANKGLVVISVSLNDTNDPDQVERAQAFLIKRNSPMRNLILDEPGDFWQKKFASKSLPFYYVFDRRGKWVRFHPDDYEGKKDGALYEALDAAVVKLLDEK